MSWKLKKKAQSLVAGEEGVVRKDWGGRVSVALVYPNTYAVGMSNLGFQTIYERLNALPDAVCERDVLPGSGGLGRVRPHRHRALLAGVAARRCANSTSIGFSVTYEGDYINVLRLLRMAGIPLRGLRPRDGRSAGAHGRCLRLLQSRADGALHGCHRRRRGRGAGWRDRRGLRRVPCGRSGGREAAGDRAAQAAPGHLRARCVRGELYGGRDHRRCVAPMPVRRPGRWWSSGDSATSTSSRPAPS